MRITAEIKFSQKGNSLPIAIISVVAILVALVALIVFLPNILNLVDEFIGFLKG